MADAQDIFILLLIILLMSNAQDTSDSGVKTVNSVILFLLLFGAFRSSTQCGCGCNNNA